MQKHPQKPGFTQRAQKAPARMRLFDDQECALMVLMCEASLRKDWKANPEILGVAHDYFHEYFERFNTAQSRQREDFSPTMTEVVADAYLQSPNVTRFFMADLNRIASRVLEQRLSAGTLGVTR